MALATPEPAFAISNSSSCWRAALPWACAASSLQPYRTYRSGSTRKRLVLSDAQPDIIRAAIAVISMRKVQFIAMLLERDSGIAVVQNPSERMSIAEEPDPVRRQWQRPTACRSAHRQSSL